jgi:hypothetical protein
MAVFAQHVSDELAHVIVIFHDEDGLHDPAAS